MYKKQSKFLTPRGDLAQYVKELATKLNREFTALERTQGAQDTKVIHMRQALGSFMQKLEDHPVFKSVGLSNIESVPNEERHFYHLREEGLRYDGLPLLQVVLKEGELPTEPPTEEDDQEGQEGYLWFVKKAEEYEE